MHLEDKNKDTGIFYSQAGEDVIVYKFFKQKGIKTGFYVDIGASDGKRFSNTYVFEKDGWNGICVEAHPDYFKLLEQNRHGAINVYAACGEEDKKECTFYANYRGSFSTLNKDMVKIFAGNNKFVGDKNKPVIQGFKNGSIQVPMMTIDTLLDTYVPKNTRIDFLTIDIDGSEANALPSFQLRQWMPTIIVAEVSTLNKFVTDFMENNGYLVARRIKANKIFCKTEEDCRIVRSIDPGSEKIIHTKHALD